MKRFILASSSPTRRQFFEKFNYPVEIIPSHYEEDMALHLTPRKLAMTLSTGKARHVAKQQTNAVVLGIDTFMVFNGELLGKPHTASAAKTMLQKLSGQTHMSISGFTVIDTDSGQEISDVSLAKVTLRLLNEQEIADYVATGEPLDKAGGYASQQMGSLFIERVEGDFYTISGVPIAKIAPILYKLGINLLKA